MVAWQKTVDAPFRRNAPVRVLDDDLLDRPLHEEPARHHLPLLLLPLRELAACFAEAVQELPPRQHRSPNLAVVPRVWLLLEDWLAANHRLAVIPANQRLCSDQHVLVALDVGIQMLELARVDGDDERLRERVQRPRRPAHLHMLQLVVEQGMLRRLWKQGRQSLGCRLAAGSRLAGSKGFLDVHWGRSNHR